MYVNKRKNNIKSLAIIILMISYIILSFFNVNLNVKVTDLENRDLIEISSTIELSNNQDIKTEIENENGESEMIATPVVELVDGGEIQVEENGLDFGKGEFYPYDTPQTFKNATLGKCIDLDSKYGSQCVDIANLYWKEYTNRWITTCGTGSAFGIWNCKEQNAGDEFELITDKNNLQAGDWIVFKGGQYGHVGMSLGNPNNGYISLLGENQGGTPCSGGGSATNIINISLDNFLGAFRPKIYIKPDPKPEPIPISGCVEWHVLRGDTMSKIMLECEGTVVYGEAMNDYAKTWYSLIYKPGQSVYDGWNSKTGVGLYAGDDIEHRLK